MRARVISVLFLVSLATAGCGGESSPAPKEATPSVSASAPTPDPAPASALKLGAPAETVGSNGTGRLELTPTSVAYLPAGGTFDKPTKDGFAFVTVKGRPTTAVAAAQAAPISGGGWSWIGSDGQAVEQGNGEAYNVVAESYNSGGTIQPGSWKWDSAVFDLTKAQYGGTLVYTDGEGKAFRWTIPAQDTGAEVAQVKKELAP